MKGILHLLIVALVVGCNAPAEQPKQETPAPAIEQKKENPLTLLIKELQRGEVDNSTFLGINFGLTKDELLTQGSSNDKATLKPLKSTGWSYGDYWQMDFTYAPQNLLLGNIHLSAFNTTGDKLDYIIAKPLFTRIPTQEDQAGKENRESFVKNHLDALKKQYGEPTYIADKYFVPKELNTISLEYHKGKAYLWMHKNQLIALVDVPLNYGVIYSTSPNGTPSLGQMMVLTNVVGNLNAHNLWEIPFPTNAISAFMLEGSMQTEGFTVKNDQRNNRKYPVSYSVTNKHPYNSFKFLLVPTGWYVKAQNKPGTALTEKQHSWNGTLKDEIIKKQGKPKYSSKEGKVLYWLHKGYITQYKENDDSIEIIYLQIY